MNALVDEKIDVKDLETRGFLDIDIDPTLDLVAEIKRLRVLPPMA